MTRRIPLLLLLLVLGLGITARPAAAQSITASLLIQTVNGLRAASGLAADQVYLTLNVIGGGSAGSVPQAEQPPAVALPAEEQPAGLTQAGAFPTATPQEDGSIVHLIVDGDTLATISETYGVGMAEIRALNGLAATSNLIFPGSYLIIATAPPPTLTPTLTPTVPRPTRTPTLVIPTRTPAPTRTASVTPIPSATPNPVVAGTEQFVETNRNLLLYVMGGLCALGLGWVVWAGFIRKPRAK